MIHCSERQGMCVAGNETQGLAPASQALSHWAISLAHSNLQSYFLLVTQLCVYWSLWWDNYLSLGEL